MEPHSSSFLPPRPPDTTTTDLSILSSATINQQSVQTASDSAEITSQNLNQPYSASVGISSSGDGHGRGPPTINFPSSDVPNHGPNSIQTTLHSHELNSERITVAQAAKLVRKFDDVSVIIAPNSTNTNAIEGLKNMGNHSIVSIGTPNSDFNSAQVHPRELLNSTPIDESLDVIARNSCCKWRATSPESNTGKDDSGSPL